MGCGCGGRGGRKSPARTPVRCTVCNFSQVKKDLVGTASKTNYGKRQDGDSVIVWQSDWLEMKDVLEKKN